ncbi:hypothetical protein C8F04DRAFT_1396462 [Mycena alexandri]|uniref:Zn(2)-C6 fungal-type domain-containing protein n=1 Tax=Mycena alexandri TaxID=1745969 RepID=A0AAD6SS15_9AGAR|nr:hypothetical protein C8F04DRAFT_1396462 [Mycena alexandri]
MNEKPKKPPACDACKARRVLCHPQPNGAPCPRCVEKNSVCTTTPVARGRPRKNPLPPSYKSSSISRRPSPPSSQQNQSLSKTSSNCPELTPNFVQHCFDGLELTPQYNHPLILSTSIKTDIRAVSFQLHLLPPQSQVLALCIICCASLNSFHPAVLGEGPRPESFVDPRFFSSCPDLRGFGVRRAPVYRALCAVAHKAAWEVGIILQPSNENAASCFLLDLLEQYDFSGASRPWANAYMSHVRALAPIWRTNEAYIISDAAHWVGHLMGDALISARSRTPMLVTPNDQLLLCGPEAQSLTMIIVSLKKFPQIPNLSLLWSLLKSYLSHVITLSRQLSDTIAGDYARTNPLSESAIISFISSLVQMHTALTLILDHVDASIDPLSNNNSPLVLDNVARTCAYGSIFGFIGLVLPFYRELQYRETCDAEVLGYHTRNRLLLLCAQAHELAVLGVRELARCLRYLPKVHYMPVHWSTIFTWAEFCAEEAESVSAAGLSPECARDIEIIVNELKLLGYSLDAVSSPSVQALIQCLEVHINKVNLDMVLPMEGGWLAGPFDVELAY